MTGEYKTNAQELLASLLKDPEKGSKLLLDIIDEKINSGVLEKLEDNVAAGLREYLQKGLEKIQAESGVFGKFAGDLVNDADAAISFIIQKADEAIDAPGVEVPTDMILQIAKPYGVTALQHQQERLAKIEITAED